MFYCWFVAASEWCEYPKSGTPGDRGGAPSKQRNCPSASKGSGQSHEGNPNKVS